MHHGLGGTMSLHTNIREQASAQGMVTRSLTLTGLVVALATGPAVSQRLPAQFQSARADDPRAARLSAPIPPEPGIHSPMLVGAGLGVLGWGIGALAGAAIESESTSGDCCPWQGVLYGGAAGGGLGLAVGAHIGNRRRGSFLLDLLTSGAVWGAGFLMMRSFAANEDYNGMALTAVVLPPVQFVATVLVERASGRSRARRSQAP